MLSAAIAQLGERQTEDLKVPGSIPGGGSFFHVVTVYFLQEKKKWYILDLCVSSLRRGHANLLCIVPIFTDGPEGLQWLMLKNIYI